ncbi:MAG TPA: prolyl oligopeptidase family serine peptidase [Gemmatimonadaceae bacterium]|nr:prolyl oligopeptidase family serine peptidase [Gemmatimonadaceae bacterium]
MPSVPTRHARLVAVAASVLLAVPLTSARAQNAQKPDYHRAEQFLTWNALQHVDRDDVTPSFYRDSTRFWYRTDTPQGAEFVTVNPALGTRADLFDPTRLASAMSLVADTSYNPATLPFRSFEFDRDGTDERVIRITAGKRGFACDIVAYTCTVADTLASRVPYVRSPDEKWDAFVSGYNVWIRPAAGGDSIRLTTDGAQYYGYGLASPTPSVIRMHAPRRPTLLWSPDSKYLAAVRYDERGVPMFPLYSSTSSRPVLYQYPYALPGDSIIPLNELYVIDIAARASHKVDDPPQSAQSYYTLGGAGVEWSPVGDRLYFTHVDRGPKHVRLMVADASGGSVRQVLADSAKTYVVGALDFFGPGTPNWRVLKNGDVLWFSERNGWGTLYRFGADGTLRNVVSRGPGVFAFLMGVDETLGKVYFTARGHEPGRNPDYTFLYSANLDGTGMTLLSPEDANHTIVPVKDGRYFVDTYSRVNVAPVTVLRGADGRVIKELERADISSLLALGWHPGEPFTALARDGVTLMTGVIYKPSNFDSTRSYPVIDHIYPGPLITPVSLSFYPSRAAFSYSVMGQVQALAELGFVVVEMNAMGNTARSTATYQQWYGNMGDNGIPDHITALRQLGARYRWMDLSRVGIYGHSGGGFSSTDALLRYPDFYKVAVSTSGNHDNRTYYYGWGERFQGLMVRDTVGHTDNFAPAANKTLVGNLQGHLFLIHGDMDDNVHPAMTIQMVDALIKANKAFDLLIVPNANHELTQNPYVIRRTWDFFVRYLMGVEPPRDYDLRGPGGN